MGNRYYTCFPCPKCGKEVEQYDAPSSCIFSALCSCGWRDERDYFSVLVHVDGEDLLDHDIVWRTWWEAPKREQAAHIGPMTEQDFENKYPKRFADYKKDIERIRQEIHDKNNEDK